jgi:cyanate permease
MTLPLDAAARPAEVGAYSGVMLSVGYLMSAIAPATLGATRDATGNFSATMLLLVAVSVVMLAISMTLSPLRLRNLP